MVSAFPLDRDDLMSEQVSDVVQSRHRHILAGRRDASVSGALGGRGTGMQRSELEADVGSYGTGEYVAVSPITASDQGAQRETLRSSRLVHDLELERSLGSGSSLGALSLATGHIADCTAGTSAIVVANDAQRTQTQARRSSGYADSAKRAEQQHAEQASAPMVGATPSLTTSFATALVVIAIMRWQTRRPQCTADTQIATVSGSESSAATGQSLRRQLGRQIATHCPFR